MVKQSRIQPAKIGDRLKVKPVALLLCEDFLLPWFRSACPVRWKVSADQRDIILTDHL